MEFFAQLRQFEFPVKMKMGLFAAPWLWLAPWSLNIAHRPNADPVGVINDLFNSQGDLP